MPFPDTERVIYNKNPIEKVICQLRFPPILIIDSEIPSKFQNEIREQYPNYKEGIEVQQEISGQFDINSKMNLINPMSKVTTSKNHVFTSEDGNWQINLTRTFISITTSKYNRWEEFKENFSNPLNSLINIYKPAFFSRIGLRYIDVFCRSKLGLESSDWSELINSPFLGLLDKDDIKQFVNSYNSTWELNLKDDVSKMRIFTGLIKNTLHDEQCFMLDSDTYTPGKTQLQDIVTKLDYIHTRSTRLVRYAITDKLHKGMEPEPIYER